MSFFSCVMVASSSETAIIATKWYLSIIQIQQIIVETKELVKTLICGIKPCPKSPKWVRSGENLTHHTLVSFNVNLKFFGKLACKRH